MDLAHTDFSTTMLRNIALSVQTKIEGFYSKTFPHTGLSRASAASSVAF